LAAALLALPLALACVTVINPVTGEREYVLMTTEQEIATGRQEAQKVAAQIGLVDAPRARDYVRAIGERLAVLSPRQDVPYQFDVVDMEPTNAFALPGGYIYVSRGLLALVNAEDELANVVAHEIGHVAALHHARRQARAAQVGLATALGSVAAAILGGGEAAQMVGQLGQVAGAGLIASHSRDQERQADEVGQELAARSGWNPAGMTSFLTTLDRETRLEHPSDGLPGFLATHPSTPERVQATAARARELQRAPGTPIARDRAALLRRLEGLRVGADPAQGLFEGSVFRHPDLDFQLRFPAGWRTQNTPTAVGALEPRQSAMLTLEMQERDTDAETAARRWLGAQRVEALESRSVRIGRAAAYRVIARASSSQGELGLHLTWIPHGGLVYRVTGLASASSYATYADDFEATAESFRSLTQRERSAIRERILGVASARGGESLAALSRRVGNAWSLEYTAVANGLETSSRLSTGQLVKVALERPYVSRSR
jgi:predicted Zn-dependent protease